MPVAQLDRASDSDSEGRTFKSCRARHKRSAPPLGGADLLLHASRARFERSAHRRQSRLLGAASYDLAIRSSAVSCRARHVAADVASFAATLLFLETDRPGIRSVTARPLRRGSSPQKVTLGSPVRLQARSRRLSVATTFCGARLRRKDDAVL